MCPGQVDRSRRPVAKTLVQPLVIVEPEIAFDPGACFRHRLVVLQVHLLVFERPPQSFNPDVVHAASAAVHADGDLPRLQRGGELLAGEVRALIAVEYLRLPPLKALFSASRQKPISNVIDSDQLSTY